MCAHLPGTSLYSEVSACTEKRLLVFETGLTNKYSFGSAKFPIDVYTCHAQGAGSTFQAGLKAELLSRHPGKAMREQQGGIQPQPVCRGATRNTAPDSWRLKV